jgi:hypothetical protein
MESIKDPKYIFWSDDLSILYKDDNYIKFIPTENMTRAEQLNSISRFAIYFFVLVILFEQNTQWLYFPIILIIFTLFLYKTYISDEEGKEKDFMKKLTKRKNLRLIHNRENITGAQCSDIINSKTPGIFSDSDKNVCNLNYDDNGIENMANLSPNSESEVYPNSENRNRGKKSYNDQDKIIVHSSNLLSDKSNPQLQVGYYDSNGFLNIDSGRKIPKYNRYKQEPLYTFDEYSQYTDATCRRPTIDNPYMNPFITDTSSDVYVPAACNADDDDVKEQIAVSFNNNLFRNVDSVWENENSQRQFYTVPNTSIPNQRNEFAEWLYKSPATCKEDNSNCYNNYYSDLRFASPK